MIPVSIVTTPLWPTHVAGTPATSVDHDHSTSVLAGPNKKRSRSPQWPLVQLKHLLLLKLLTVLLWRKNQ